MNLPRWLLTGLTIVVLPGEGGESRSFALSGRVARMAVLGVALLTLVGLAMVGSWAGLALRAARAVQLQETVDSLAEENQRILGLADELARIEREYEHIRGLFGPPQSEVSQGLWLPPSGLPAGQALIPAAHADLPTSWPLTESGFVTQGLFAGDAGDHPGLDIAIASGSYVRAAGAGKVVRVGEDAAYGRFVVLEHGEGYQSVYGHTSMVLVERGASVRQNEVIALTGSTGRSTAPHLHFEILLDGAPVDPLTMVEQPG